MKTIIDRKQIQEKLKSIISDYVKMLIETDSKKLKKSIKKASKSIAKAIVKNVDESDGQVTLKNTAEANKLSHLKPKASTAKHNKTSPSKKPVAKSVQKSKKQKHLMR